MKGLGRRRVRIEHGERFARIGLGHDVGIERDSAKKRHAHIVCRGFPAAFAEDFDMVVAVRALQSAHVFHDADDRHVTVFAERD